jgi:hypothetical protein
MFSSPIDIILMQPVAEQCVCARNVGCLRAFFLFSWVWVTTVNSSGPDCDFFDFDAMNRAAELT